MPHRRQAMLDFGSTLRLLQSDQIWEYDAASTRTCEEIAGETRRCLEHPLDFPPLDAAIVPGDHVAIAADPNAPSIVEVIQGAVESLKLAGASDIDIILSDEASRETLESIAQRVGESAKVLAHRCSQRESLRYLAADAMADPIYLNRWLVDADFVLPIVAGRRGDGNADHDITGVFPTFADSRARRRYFAQRCGQPTPSQSGHGCQDEPAWLLGIQLMISVLANERGQVSQVVAGTPDAIRKHAETARRSPDDFPPAASLVIASLDGDAQQQSWENAARAVEAAAQYASPGGTIVVWSEIAEAVPLQSSDQQRVHLDQGGEGSAEIPDGLEEEGFPEWDSGEAAARTLARIAEEFRVLIHSRLGPEAIESMGYGCIESADELNQLCRTVPSCGILRAAQFAGTAIDLRAHGE